VSKEARKKRHGFTGEFKLSAPARLAETDSIVGLARELGLERKLLYCWREQYQQGRLGGIAACRAAGQSEGSTCRPGRSACAGQLSGPRAAS